ncbi:putative choline transporter, neither null mutation nor overexpression affects choline transport [Basidiobolus ranarum]|uniref:Protein PNS1 n=1 Tax=Basidiobolus ranarum TaxID=34480 RepID=A0ABR2VRP9_9FUNG
MGGLLGGVITGLITYLFILIFKPAVNNNGQFTIIFILFGFIIGLTLFILVAEVIESGTATTFVCLAEDPNALRQSQPELFEKIRQTYPEVVQGV